MRPGVGIDLALLAQALAERPIKACWLMGNVQHPLATPCRMATRRR